MGGLTWATLRADLLALSAVSNFALSYVLTKAALAEWHPLVFTGTRFAAMAAIGVGVLGAQRRLHVVFGADFPRFALGGLCGFTLYQLGFVLGLDRTSAFSSTLLLTTIPVCSLLFLWIGGVEPVEHAQWGGVGLAAAGIATFIWAEEGGPRLAEARVGDLLSLGAAASFALFGIVGKPLSARYPPSTVLAGTLLLGSLPLLPLSLLAAPGRSDPRISVGGWAIWAYAVVVPVYLGYTWWTAAIAARGVAAIAPYTLLVPILGGLLAVGWLGEHLSETRLVGATLTLVGLALGRGWLRWPRCSTPSRSSQPDGSASGPTARLRTDYDLPPLMFDRHEIQALVLGARIVRQLGDPALAHASETLLAKVAAVIPKPLEALLGDARLFVPTRVAAAPAGDVLMLAREALIAHRKLRLQYTNAQGEATERVVRPLGVFFWGRAWTLAVWCELRSDFRNFRLDRVIGSTLLDTTFADEPGRTLRDLLTRYGPEAVRLLDG